MKNLADKADLADMCPTMGILCMLVLERLVWWVPFCLLHQGEPLPDQQQQLDSYLYLMFSCPRTTGLVGPLLPPPPGGATARPAAAASQVRRYRYWYRDSCTRTQTVFLVMI